MVTELLSNQSGSDSIISSVEEMQRQLNEQEGRIYIYLLKYKIIYFCIYSYDCVYKFTVSRKKS